MVKDQVITENYAIYNSDCMHVLAEMQDQSIDLSVYSPPFAGLYNYSSSEHDFSNCESKEQFLQQYEFLIAEIARVTKPGRISAVHVTDVMDSKTGLLWDFPNEVIRIHEKYGMHYRNKITIWKEPLKVRMRTMVKSLMHKLIVEDSTECFTAMPDYVLIFKKHGENAVPVTHTCGLTHYAGEVPLLPHMIEALKGEIPNLVKDDGVSMDEIEEMWAVFEALKKKYHNFEGDHKLHRYSHAIWRRYASSVWDDIRIDNVLPYQDSKDPDDEKHVHPLQLDVVDRIVDLYSNPGEIVLTPFMGVGTEVYAPVSMGRFGIGIELKESYFRQAVLNLQDAEKRFQETKQPTLF